MADFVIVLLAIICGVIGVALIEYFIRRFIDKEDK